MFNSFGTILDQVLGPTLGAKTEDITTDNRMVLEDKLGRRKLKTNNLTVSNFPYLYIEPKYKYQKRIIRQVM